MVEEDDRGDAVELRIVVGEKMADVPSGETAENGGIYRWRCLIASAKRITKKTPLCADSLHPDPQQRMRYRECTRCR
jgi:hypothetical protein